MQVLKLPSFKIVNGEELDRSIRFVLETTSDPNVCQACGDLTAKIVKYGTRKQRYMDMPIRGKAVDLLVRRKRFRCYSRNRTFFEHLGSGTTAVACERLGRRWIGIEISLDYVKIAVKRIERERSQMKLCL